MILPGRTYQGPLLLVGKHIFFTFIQRIRRQPKLLLMVTDAELQMQIAEGDESSFQRLFERHRDKLFNYLFSIVKSREIAEELVIDVFLRLWIGRELLTEIQNMDAFLHKVAYNKAIDFLRI